VKVIDPKYHIEGEKIINTSNGEEVPDDEPMILFRARDNLAVNMLKTYWQISIEAGCTDHHISGVAERISQFERFAYENPERMKQPGRTLGK